jgi:GT2 family glycosyltransferase
MKLGILILNYNGMRWLPGLMKSLNEAAIPNQRVYVVDNASNDESLDYLAKEHPDVIVIRHAENLGYAAAYNRAIPQAFDDGCDWVCLQNTDTLVDRDWLQPIVAASSSDPRIGIMGPVFVEWETDQPNYYMKGRCKDLIPTMFDESQMPIDRDWVEGSSFFINKGCFESIGGLDPLYFMYWEEADYCRRARYNRWRVCIVPGSVCKHFAGGSSTTKGPGFLQIRNHFFYQLTDPFHSFPRNVLGACRLGATYLKQCTWDNPAPARILQVSKSLVSAAWHAGRCFNSWKMHRDPQI